MGAAIFVVLLAFFGVAWANSIIRPVRHISERISRGGRSDAPIEVPPADAGRDPAARRSTRRDEGQPGVTTGPDRGGRATTGWRCCTRCCRRASRSESPAVTSARSSRRPRPRSWWSSSSVSPISSDRPTAPTTVSWSITCSPNSTTSPLDHGLDRIKVVGDAYYAACGHDRQYIDHAPRTVGFAIDAMHALDTLDTDMPLALAVGVHSGPVTTGMAGGASLVYDVWGATVSRAHRLARQARRGQILVSAHESRAASRVDRDHADGRRGVVRRHVVGRRSRIS